MSLLQIKNLQVSTGRTFVLQGIDLSLERGKIMGLVGESGSGKSVAALTIMKLLPRKMTAKGQIFFDGLDILTAPEIAMCRLRGKKIAMIFQEPTTALNPLKTIGAQVAEGIRWHAGANRAEAEIRASAMLERVGLSEERRSMLNRYPHELSGGQRQRVLIAIACTLNPQLLIADEATTALDSVLQAQILDLLRELVDETGMSLLLISHDLAIVSQIANKISILRNGRITESGDTIETFTNPKHAYTRQLVKAFTHIPMHVKAVAKKQNPPILLEVKNISRDYPLRCSSLFSHRGTFRAVNQVSFSIRQGQSVALVGQSGCGKSTLKRMILALDRPSEGSVSFNGALLEGKTDRELRSIRRDLQAVFQDPYGSFNPRQKVERLLAEPLYTLNKKFTRSQERDIVANALIEVGLSTRVMERFPHEFSGGQRQRLSIARAIVTKPKLIVADEPISALDASIRAQILDLFVELNHKLGVAYLFIMHDLTVARTISEVTMVMHKGQIVEKGPSNQVLMTPKSETARALIDAEPDLHKIQLQPLDGLDLPEM